MKETRRTRTWKGLTRIRRKTTKKRTRRRRRIKENYEHEEDLKRLRIKNKE